MKLRIVWVGKTRNPQIAKLCKDYISRIEHFLPLNIAEVKETEKILANLDVSDRVVALDAKGKTWTSEQLANFVQQHMNSDARRLTFVIGDYDGLSETVKRRADIHWSLSPLTLTHDLSRVVLLEQLYRAMTIIRNIPYSK
jgi:23S rRNA (pseudouridine1915-N3)-methyltransferase